MQPQPGRVRTAWQTTDQTAADVQHKQHRMRAQACWQQMWPLQVLVTLLACISWSCRMHSGSFPARLHAWHSMLDRTIASSATT